MPAAALPFTHEMVVVHKAYRREFGQGPSWVRRVAAGDTAQAGIVYRHMVKVFEALHHHHEAEDTELWPRLRERAVDSVAVLDVMEAQHAGIDPAIARARAAGERWADSADAASREEFAVALEEIAGPLLAHLDQEEAEILPLAQQYLSEQEWGLLAKHAISHTPKSDLLSSMGGILEDATPEERAMMLGVMPAVPKLLYRLIGRRAYIKNATAVRGTAPVGL